MTKLFQSNLVYPSDHNGTYVECEGTVVLVDAPAVEVDTEHGVFVGYAAALYERGLLPRVGDLATIRIYDQGGGHYPDHQLMSWKSPAVEKLGTQCIDDDDGPFGGLLEAFGGLLEVRTPSRLPTELGPLCLQQNGASMTYYLVAGSDPDGCAVVLNTYKGWFLYQWRRTAIGRSFKSNREAKRAAARALRLNPHYQIAPLKVVDGKCYPTEKHGPMHVRVHCD